jgi:uncharacterized protein (TIGR03118 family)
MAASCLAVSSWTLSAAGVDGYRKTDLTADTSGVAHFADPHLVNPWGLVGVPGGHLIVADNHAGVATFYSRQGKPLPLMITIQAPGGGDSAPTDLAVVNHHGIFHPRSRHHQGGPLLLFSTEDGTIAAWDPSADATQASLVVDNSTNGAIYKGLALAVSSGESKIFAANFGQGMVEEYDADYQWVKSFTDNELAGNGYVPFGIRVFGESLFVTYAFKANPDDDDETSGPGLGYVDEFDLDGNLVRHFASQGNLNAPWGMVMAPGSFGRFGKALLVGNFGDGAITAYDRESGAILGQLTDTTGAAIRIEGLWGLAFNHGDPRLYYTAGPDDENHGVLGALQPQRIHSGMGY